MTRGTAPACVPEARRAAARPGPRLRRIPRRSSLALVLAGAVALVAGCASGAGSGDATGGPTGGLTGDATGDATTGAPSPAPAPTLELAAGSSVVGLPAGLAAPPVDATAGAARTAEDGLLYVVAFGSGSCPSVADPAATGTGDGTVTVTFPDLGDGPCTRDWVPATTVVALPGGVGSEGDLTVTIGELGAVTLPAGSDEPAWVQPEG